MKRCLECMCEISDDEALMGHGCCASCALEQDNDYCDEDWDNYEIAEDTEPNQIYAR